MRNSVVTGLIHFLSIHERKGKGLKASMDMHEVEGSDWGCLGDESDVSRDKISCMNMIDKDSMVEVVSFGEEMIKRVGKLGGENNRFPLGIVSSGIEVGHRVMEAFMKVWVRGGSSRGLRAFGRFGG